MKKPFAIERRIKPEKIPEGSTFLVNNGFTKWHKCKSYATTTDRGRAIKALSKKTGVFEYRVKED